MKHFILTGRNGSGKTTVLNRIEEQVRWLKNGYTRRGAIKYFEDIIKSNPAHTSFTSWTEQIERFNDVELIFATTDEVNLMDFRTKTSEYIYSYFPANRITDVAPVNSVTTEDEFIKKLTTPDENLGDYFIRTFKQYIVNKKIYEAFDLMENKLETTSQNKIFFDNFTQILKAIFQDNGLSLQFIKEKFEFYIIHSGGRKVSFNQLSAGFSSFLNIIMDILVKTDILRKVKNDYSFNPPGIAVIDEPENHLHISMQYEILPLITTLFPNIQLIIATHSPAIISSLKNAIVYDLSSQKEVSDWLLGSSYSELMITHFGLDNEFSPIADEIINKINVAVKNKDVQALKSIVLENEKYLTPSLQLEIQSRISIIESQL